MNFINRAFKNVTRRLSKTVLLILTFFLIGNLVIIGLGVSKASESAKTLTRQKMRAVVTYTLDYDAIYEYAESLTDEDEINEFYQNYPRINLSDVEELLKDERVKTANATNLNMWYSDSQNSIDFVHLNNKAEENMGQNGMECWYDENNEQRCESYKEPYFAIKGNMFPSMIEVEDGEYTITSGRFYTQDEIRNGSFVCLITEALAQTNGISVGDEVRFSVQNVNSWMQDMGITTEDTEVTFEVIGIYNHNHPITPDAQNYDYCSPMENPDNTILMPTTSSYMASLPVQQKQFDYYAANNPEEEYYSPENRPSEDKMDQMIYLENTTLLLNDPLEVEKFVEDYNGSLSQFKKLDANNEEFNRLAKPLDTLSMYANFIVWLVVINAIVIITLVTALTLKNREYEIGVLLSIGASKLKVIAQFFLELAIVAVIGFTLSVVSGSLIAKKIGNTVLEYQITSSGVEDGENWGSDYYSPWDTDYTTDISLADLVDEYEVTISPLIIAEIYILGLAIVFISVIIPSFMIMRYNPKKILMNQN
jgi:ABC-type antimicrobial peptide transport system permease subunit